MDHKDVFSVLLSFTLLLSAASSRKYDVGQEAVLLFGESLHTVLRKFRRTHDYLRILTGKKAELHNHMDRTTVLIRSYYGNYEIPKRVDDVLGIPTSSTAKDATTGPTFRYFNNLHSRRQNTEDNTDAPIEEEASDKAVKRLDSYSKLSSPLTVSEKNAFRDLGFEIAGDIIHKLIDSLSPDDGPPRITQGPGGAGPTSTVHVQIHEVTTTTLAPATEQFRVQSTADGNKKHRARERVTRQEKREVPKRSTSSNDV